MRRALLAVLVGGCGFTATNASSSDGNGAAAIDAPPGTTDAPATEHPAPSELCAPTSGTAQGHVVACFELDGNADDATGHLTAHATNLTFPDGKVGKAMSFGATSAADYDDSSALDVASLTIELWLQVAALPGDTVYLLDVNDQYAFQLKSDGNLHCTLSGATSIDASPKLSTGTWHHLACTWDATTGTAAIYVDGSQSNSEHGDDDPLHTSGTTGLSLAADNPPGGGGRQRLIGLLDQVRLLDYARSGSEICADAGLQNCQ